MAEGGYDPNTENETPWEDAGIDHDDNEEEEEEFKTPLSSPIKPPPEEIEMHRLPREQNGRRRQQRAWDTLKKLYPQADEDALEVSYVKRPEEITSRLAVKKIGAPRAYWLLEPDIWGRWNENPDLPSEIKNLLGKSIEEQIKDLKRMKVKKIAAMIEKQTQKKRLEKNAEARNKLNQEIYFINQEIQNVEAEERKLEETHGKVDIQALQKLKNEKKELESEKKTIQKQLKQQQQVMKEYHKIQTEIEQLVHEKREIDQNLSFLRAQEETLKPLDQLEQEVKELERKITEDKQLIEDENTSPSERAAAEARVAENEAELDRANAELEARERERPLLERIKDIFKKYGWTLDAFFIAVGVVLGAIALAAKKGTKVISQKLNDVKQQPGFIGSIVNFLFKTASQVFAFLSEHTWLLILAVVAFFMEKMLKRRRR